MTQQIVAIHGGNTFEDYEDYLNSLRTKEISLEKIRFKGWKENLKEELGESFDVITPKMPNGQNARYLEWKIWFERIIPLLNDEIIFIGHSLGGIFLAKYLSEKTYPKKIKATILIAAPFNEEDGGESLMDFNLPSSLTKIEEQGGEVYLIQSKDDLVVKFGQFEKYKKALPNAKTIVFEDRGHFHQESFPEIIELIKKL
jgi:uncharacterized protein